MPQSDASLNMGVLGTILEKKQNGVFTVILDERALFLSIYCSLVR